MKVVKKIRQEKTGSKKLPATRSVSVSAGQQSAIFIVGIGASAGGLEALKLFFDHASTDIGLAFVIVQHLDPTHKSLLAELISGHSKMIVREVINGEKVRPDHVYVIPPNKDLKLLKQRLHLTDLSKVSTVRKSIDSFFGSLAKDQKEKAIGVILSGTGTDGVQGLKEIKAQGGMTIVQDPATAQFNGMPQSAITTGIADFILPPEKMPEKLISYIHKLKSSISRSMSEPLILVQSQLDRILQHIRSQTGYDFSNYKTTTITRRIGKRVALLRLNSVEEYIKFIKENPEEAKKLYKVMLIGVTTFFRDQDVFENLESKAIPHLLRICESKQEIRVWVCGCSTGEEAYSLAILFKEAFRKYQKHLKVTIFASDIDSDSIEVARVGTYKENISSHVSPERLERYFTKVKDGFQLKKEIRELIVFAQHNLVKDPPFSKLDLITCRNLLIYIKSELQKQIIATFHYSLNNDGLLLLGTSESIGQQNDLFTTMDAKNKIFKRNDIQVRKPIPPFTLPVLERKSDFKRHTGLSAPRIISKIADITERILSESAPPPSVIIDKNDEVLYFSGDTSRYLATPEGVAILKLPEMANRDLKRALTAGIRKARNYKTSVLKKSVSIEAKGSVNVVNLSIKPLFTRQYDAGTLIVIFEPVEAKQADSTSTGDFALGRLTDIDLESALKITRDDLQLAFNSLETANEDLQSVNEELQSSNEELETSREELQSLNEELITVNAELGEKINQLSQANNDLNNLLRSIEVATVYLDRTLKVKRFTPAATKIFNLINADIDRPLTQLSINLYYKTLTEDISHVLKTLEAKTIEVNSLDGTWYKMRIIPYRTIENVIEGVLITLVDITEQKNVQQNLLETGQQFDLVMENLPAVPYRCTSEREFSFVGKSCAKVMGFLPEQFIGKSRFWIDRIHPDDRKKNIDAYANISKRRIDDQTFRWQCPDGKYEQFTNYIRYVDAENGGPPYIAGVWQRNV